MQTSPHKIQPTPQSQPHKQYPSLLDAIGNTPLIRLAFDVPPVVLAKLEFANPGGSIKDRSALYMIEQAERSGQLKPGGTIIDASSGNQGIAVAMIGACKGYRVVMVVTEKMSKEKLQALKSYGAEIVICKPTAHLQDPESYHNIALQLHRDTPNSYMPNQYFNTLNMKAHYTSLGPELWHQTHGTITHLFAAAGTGGHVSGAGAYLKERNPSIEVIAVDSNNSWHATGGNPKPYGLEGIGIDFDSPNLNKQVISSIATVSDEEAIPTLRTLARQHGILVGPASGAVAAATLRHAAHLKESDCVVMVFSDSGRAYLTKQFYE